MSQDHSPDNGQPTASAPRQPPSFVPTLTHMVQPASIAKADPTSQASASMPAAFAELLNDWPVLGEPAATAEPAPALGAHGPEKRDEDVTAERRAELIAQRAEALVLQRLPALMAGLVSRAVRDAIVEVGADRAPQLKGG